MMKKSVGNILPQQFTGFLKLFFYLAAVSFILLWPAFWNGYPLVFSDTGTYIFSAFTLEVPVDRPVGYGLLLRFFLTGGGLWFAVYAQAFLTAWLLWKTVGVFFQARKNVVHLSAMVLLSFATTLPWVAGQVMPDLFTGLMFLVIFVFVYGKNVLFERLVLAAVLFFLLITHSANFLLAGGLLGIMFLVSVSGGFSKNSAGAFLRLVVLFGVTVAALVFFLLSNYHQGNGFVVSPSSHVFLMSRVNDAGILDSFLETRCKNTHYFLCDFRGKFSQGDGFIWNADSPVNIAGWGASKTEYDNILRVVFTSPDLVLRFAGDSFARSFRLFCMVGMDPFLPYGPASSVYEKIRRYFPGDLDAFVRSKQYRGEFTPLHGFSAFFAVVFCVSMLYSVWLLLKKRLSSMERLLFLQVVLFFLMNALVMATLSGDYGRYQERMLWLLPLIPLFCRYRENFSK